MVYVGTAADNVDVVKKIIISEFEKMSKLKLSEFEKTKEKLISTLSLGVPAKVVRSLDQKDLEMIRDTNMNYQNLKRIYHSIFLQKNS
jgi:hypothetical protein